MGLPVMLCLVIVVYHKSIFQSARTYIRGLHLHNRDVLRHNPIFHQGHMQNRALHMYDYAAEGSSSLAVPYDPYSQEEGAQEVNPDSSATDQGDLDPEDGTGNYMDRAADLSQYFTVGVQDDSDPYAVVLDQHMG